MTKEELESLFLDSTKFFKAVEVVKSTDVNITYLEAVMMVCDDKEIDPEDLVRLKLISPLLKSHLQRESEDAGLVRREATRIPYE